MSIFLKEVRSEVIAVTFCPISFHSRARYNYRRGVDRVCNRKENIGKCFEKKSGHASGFLIDLYPPLPASTNLRSDTMNTRTIRTNIIP